MVGYYEMASRLVVQLRGLIVSANHHRARDARDARALDAVDRMVVKSAMEDLRKVADSLDADAWMYRPKREA